MHRLLPFLLLAAACTGGGASTPTPTGGAEAGTVAPSAASTTTLPVATLPLAPPPRATATGDVKTISHRLDGNRYALGAGAVPQAEPVDVALGGVPVWVVGVELGGQPMWIVSLENGSMVQVAGEAATPLATTTQPGAPFAMVSGGDDLEVLAAEGGESPLTHPIVVDGRRVAVLDDGSLQIGAENLEVGALPDARLVADESGGIALLTGPTDEYAHAVLGDATEASSLTIVDPAGLARVVNLGPGLVAEGIAPIWADLDGDGRREEVVTLSDARDGARIVAGEAAGPPIGQGRRWRHQIAVAPFGPNGEVELVAVRTPHIGGVAEFYDAELNVVAEARGVTSHVLGSRNLDMALAADADGDGRVELVAPTEDLESLAAIRREGPGARLVWTVPLGGRLATNLAAVELPGGVLALAAGTEDGNLRIWPPAELDTGNAATLDRMLADVAVLLANGPRVAGTPAEDAAGDHLLRTLQGWYTGIEIEPVALPTGGTTRNFRVSAGTAGTRLLLGGHYDSKEGSPGADDNASGVAVLLELARRLSLAPPAGLTVDIVFFGGEEIPTGFPADEHHFGSRHMAARLEEEGALPDLMVSVDMIGVGDRLLAVTFEDTDPAAAQALLEAAGELGVVAEIVPRGDISDHEAFARRGVPSVFMWRPDNPAYHTPDDTDVRPELLVEDLAILEAMLENLERG